MEPQYFARVDGGIVLDVRRTTIEYLEANPSLYEGTWVLVKTDDLYPAIGWSWSLETGFVAPPAPPDPEE